MMNNVLSIYYNQLGHDHYHDENDVGPFMKFLNDEGLEDDELIEAELGNDGNPKDCLLSTFWNGEFLIPIYVQFT